jgi:hypothetical protein
MLKRIVKRVLPASITRQLQSPGRFDELQREIADLRSIVEDQHRVILSLNHAIVYGGETGLPLMVDIVDRIRSDAETTIGAVHAMHRLLSIATQRLEALAERVEAVASESSPPSNA